MENPALALQVHVQPDRPHPDTRHAARTLWEIPCAARPGDGSTVTRRRITFYASTHNILCVEAKHFRSPRNNSDHGETFSINK